MYHDVISRKSNITTIKEYRFNPDIILEIVHNMLKSDAETTYENYHIYKKIFYEFSHEIESIDKHINVVLDSSNVIDKSYPDISDILVKNINIIYKHKSVIDLLK